MDLTKQRDHAIKRIEEGKKKYNAGATFEDKELGYTAFKTGVEYLVDYYKKEDNEHIKKIVVEKIKEFMKDLEQMKVYMDSQRAARGQAVSAIAPSQGPTKPDSGKLPASGNEEKDKENEKFKQSLTEAIVTEKPNVKWDDIAGLDNAKKALQEAVILPIKFPHIFVGTRTPWKGILLYGPPGTGKTYLAKACATEADGTFFSISSSDLMSKWVGESEKLIKTLFNLAREKKPAIIFIDEIDSLCGNRSDGENEATRRVKTEFLVQMQGVGKDDTGVLVLGATNIPWGLDPAIRRRFEKRIYISLPEEKARLYLLKNLMKKNPHSLDEDDFNQVAAGTEGFSGSDISILVRDACFEPLRTCQRATHFKQAGMKDGKILWTPCGPSDSEGKAMTMMDLSGDQLKLADVTIEDFMAVLQKVKPSVSQADIGKQIEFTQQFGMEG